jgi:hypothetical protein
MQRLFLLALAGLTIVVFASWGGAAAPDDVDQDAELRGLHKARLEAVTADVEATAALYRGGRVSLERVCDAIGRYSTAGIEAARTPAYRVKVCERAFESAKAIEDLAKGKFEAEVEPIQSMKLATYTRLEMEIRLHKARNAQKAQQVRSKLDDSDLPPLAPAERPATRT